MSGVGQRRFDAAVQDRVVLDDSKRHGADLASARVSLHQTAEGLSEQLMTETDAEHRLLLTNGVGQVLFGAQHPRRAFGHARRRPGDDQARKAPGGRQALGLSRVDLDEAVLPNPSEPRAHQVGKAADTRARLRHRVAGDEDAQWGALHVRSIARRRAVGVTVAAVRIRRVEILPWDVELLEPFGIATGAQVVANNALCEVELESGARGLGEAAPFPAVNGETQADALAALHAVADQLVGESALPETARARLEQAPSALAAVEMALLDAQCRARGESLFRHFGGQEPRLRTDITIPTGGAERAADAAQRAMAQGFQTLKIKVGGEPFDHDVARLRRIAAAAPGARLLLDANASLPSAEAIELVAALGAARSQVVLFEQPCLRGDYAGSRRVREAGIRVAADEDARSLADLGTLKSEGAADVINFKLTKSGVTRALEMIAEARRLGFGLMMGGMVETRLAMTFSACIAGGQGGFEELDLDTPLFMKDDLLSGGFAQQGPSLDLSEIALGHGVSRRD